MRLLNSPIRSEPRPGTWTSRRAFSLIEIMVVIVILGILAGLIIPRIMGRPEQAKQLKARMQIESISTALKLYKLDNGGYPTTEQGLEALVEASTLDPEPRNFKEGGYLEELPLDPWGRPYLYLSPGENGEVDLYSLGADGLSGGEDQNADIGNWKEDDQ